MSLAKRQLADLLEKSAKGQKLGVSRFEKTLKIEFKEAVNDTMVEIADQYSVQLKLLALEDQGI